MLVVQQVEILWSKLTRGAPASNVRARLPRGFAFEPAEAEYLFHHVRITEWQDFEVRTIKLERRDQVPRTEGGLYMRKEADNFLLGLIRNPAAGKPHRHPVMQAITLHKGEFARLIINGRHSSYSGQWYSEYVYNVGWGNVSPTQFANAEPTHTFDLSANLF